jgi:hypothetical protein
MGNKLSDIIRGLNQERQTRQNFVDTDGDYCSIGGCFIKTAPQNVITDYMHYYWLPRSDNEKASNRPVESLLHPKKLNYKSNMDIIDWLLEYRASTFKCLSNKVDVSTLPAPPEDVTWIKLMNPMYLWDAILYMNDTLRWSFIEQANWLKKMGY